MLERAQRLGFLGPGPLSDHVEHARALARFVGAARSPVLDLGAGGGVPGLVLAGVWPEAEIVLLDAGRRRTEHLEAAVYELALGDRVAVVQGRAEVVARDPRHRARYQLVVARAFGAPAVTAECAVGFLCPGGAMVVSEPPSAAARWPADDLATLGLRVSRRSQPEERAFVEILCDDGPPPRWPRRDGVPTKRPLWT